MNQYEEALECAWNLLIAWVKEGKFVPRNEEDIQCFLYHGLVQSLGTAKGVRPKATTSKSSKLKFRDGKRDVGDMHFPDLALGEDESHPDLVIEIKFRPTSRASFYGGCMKDIEKLKRHHAGRPHYFVLFDAHPEYVFLDQHQLTQLRTAASENCRILHYPLGLNTSPGKFAARKAIESMRKKGVDIAALGKQSAVKAVKGSGG